MIGTRPLETSVDEKASVRQQMTSSAAVAQATLTASEKLRQRRPTKAILNDRFEDQDHEDSDSSSEQDEDGDNGEEDVDFQFANLAARRACLNERFLAAGGQQNQKTTSELQRKRSLISAGSDQPSEAQQKRQATIQRSSTICGSSRMSQQRAKLNAVANNGTNAKSGGPNNRNRPAYNDYDEDDDREPRSIGTVQLVNQSRRGQSTGGAPVTMMSHLYKPHMNYSTSALGNHHRLSDDDEIIIIPTTRSPTVSPALLSSRNCSPMDARNANNNNNNNHLDEDDDTSNVDELSERFSISRTKSFWEKLTKAKCGPKVSANEQQQQSARSPLESMMGAELQPAIVGVRSNGNSPYNSKTGEQLLVSKTTVGGSPVMQQNHGNKLVGIHQASFSSNSQTNRSRGQLLDSSGGSGNSNYSCSSGSGDENNLPIQHQQKNQTHSNSRSSPLSLQQPISHQQQRQQEAHQSIRNNNARQQEAQQPKRTNCPKTVKAISQQLQEMSRANSFRQTR